jgi:arabinogalactan endo-1,4-beta-galactosidase
MKLQPLTMEVERHMLMQAVYNPVPPCKVGIKIWTLYSWPSDFVLAAGAPGECLDVSAFSEKTGEIEKVEAISRVESNLRGVFETTYCDIYTSEKKGAGKTAESSKCLTKIGRVMQTQGDALAISDVIGQLDNPAKITGFRCY